MGKVDWDLHYRSEQAISFFQSFEYSSMAHHVDNSKSLVKWMVVHLELKYALIFVRRKTSKLALDPTSRIQ
jgi:hypothetical protein